MGVYLGAVMPEVIARFSLSQTGGGLIFVVWSLGFTAGSFLSERMLRKREPLSLLTILSMVTALVAAAQTYADTKAIFMALYGGLGLTGGAIFTASHTLYGQLFQDRRASALSVLDLLFSLGNMSAPLSAIAIFWFGLDWQDFFLFCGLGFLLSAACFAVFLRSRRRPPEGTGISDKKIDGHEPKVGSHPHRRRLVVLCLSVGSLGLGALEWTQNVWLVSFAIGKGFDEATARYAMAIFTAGMIAARLTTIAAGRLAQDPRLIVTFFLIGAIGVPFLFGDRPATLWLGNFLLGSGLGALLPIFLGRAMDGDPARSALYSMVMIVMLTIGGQLASLRVGVLADGIGIAFGYGVIVLFLALAIGGFGLLLIMRGKDLR